MAVEFQPVADQSIAKAARNRLLQFLNLLIAKFDELAGRKVDEMVVMLSGGLLVARPAVKRVPFQDAFFLEKAHGAVDRGKRNAAIGKGSTAVQFFDIRMIGGFGNDAGDGPALSRHPHALFNAGALDVIHSEQV